MLLLVFTLYNVFENFGICALKQIFKKNIVLIFTALFITFLKTLWFSCTTHILFKILTVFCFEELNCPTLLTLYINNFKIWTVEMHKLFLLSPSNCRFTISVTCFLFGLGKLAMVTAGRGLPASVVFSS